MLAVCLQSYTICLCVDNFVQFLFPVVENPVWSPTESLCVFKCMCVRQNSVYVNERKYDIDTSCRGPQKECCLKVEENMKNDYQFTKPARKCGYEMGFTK